MKILVDALSVTNLSGRSVLIGHLSRIAPWSQGTHEYLVLYHASNKDICKDLGSNVQWVECPSFTSGWIGRTIWQYFVLPGLVKKINADILFTLSGMAISSVCIPQMSYAMNPWSLVKDLKLTPMQQIKAYLQRREYRVAMNNSAVMIFLSEYMRHEYRKNAGVREKDSNVVYTGIDDELFTIAEQMSGREKKHNKILSVSAMAPHKGVETLVRAIGMVRDKNNIDVVLDLVGGWPDHNYKNTIKLLVKQLGLDDAVNFYDHVTREELYNHYSEAKVFCLMSWCESFGIPAVEAQAFGNPVVSSNCCAIPEVCGDGGVYPEPGDVHGVAYEIAQLLTKPERWKELSEKAKENANRFHWDITSMKLKNIIDKLSQQTTLSKNR